MVTNTWKFFCGVIYLPFELLSLPVLCSGGYR